MHLPSKPKIVVLGMMTKMPVAGVVWQTMHYLVGFERLGCEVYYVEQHARTPSMFMETEQCDGSAKAAAFIDSVMRRFDLGGRWCFHALHEDEGRCLGMSRTQLNDLFASAALIINLHGGTVPLPEHYATGRLIYLETDPVQLQIELHDNVPETIDFLAPHAAFFTFGENLGHPDCGLPVSERFEFKPTRQPVVMDFWNPPASGPGETFTSIGNWQQHWREVSFKGERYSWSKHHEFLKIVALPQRTPQRFELALASYSAEEKTMLESHGWSVRHAMDFSMDTDAYRDYIASSRGEFTVAKDQNVRLRSGWFSDRSATYLAAGRPVITQETGFSNLLPTGAGLFGFSTIEEILGAVEEINGDYAGHSAAAVQAARECFSHEVVLGRLLGELGVTVAAVHQRPASACPPRDLVLTPVSRRPIRLRERTVRAVLELALPAMHFRAALPARTSVVMVTYGQFALNKLCLLNLLEQTDEPDCEVLVVDNGSTDGTAAFLRELAACDSRVRAILNPSNRGFAAATNQGLAAAAGDIFILLNNDTLVARGWLARLAAHLADPTIGLLGAVTNRIGNQAEIPVDYATLGGFLRFARERARGSAGGLLELPMAAMFCLAMRRDTFERIGPLDEQFETGMFEDDDYAMRCRAAGLRVACAEDVFVHHFGEASFGELCPSGKYGEVFAANRARFEQKWNTRWESHAGREKAAYRDLVARLHAAALAHTPPGASVLVVSKGDPALVDIPDRRAAHFPQSASGGYAGHHPADGAQAVAELERLRVAGAHCLVIPETSAWWLEHYAGLREYLTRNAHPAVELPETCRLFIFNRS